MQWWRNKGPRERGGVGWGEKARERRREPEIEQDKAPDLLL
jgi:hypothetical protein